MQARMSARCAGVRACVCTGISGRVELQCHRARYGYVCPSPATLGSQKLAQSSHFCYLRYPGVPSRAVSRARRGHVQVPTLERVPRGSPAIEDAIWPAKERNMVQHLWPPVACLRISCGISTGKAVARRWQPDARARRPSTAGARRIPCRSNTGRMFWGGRRTMSDPVGGSTS